jgi:SSS family solute:Na+ symporter
MPDLMLASLSAKFTGWDWAVVVGYLVFTTWLGTAMAGKQASIRDFFLGGRKLPWYAVSGSIIATEISALTFVSVPFVVFKPGGNFTYLQLGIIGSLLARVIVGYWLVPAYYKREIYSPYDYMGNQLGGRMRQMTTALFTLGGMLSQSARVYLTAIVLTVVLRDQLSWLAMNVPIGFDSLGWAIVLISIVAITWTLVGGISTVIWTDAILFLVFLIGAFVALFTVASKLPGGFGEIFTTAWAAKESGPWGKFTLLNFDTSLAADYTIYTAAIAATWGGIFAYGTDQLLVQRIFCCKGERQARLAIISSTASQIVTLIVMLVGAGLFVFYSQQPDPAQVPGGVTIHETFPNLYGEARTMYEQKGDRIFPIFIVDQIPVFLKGLIVAGIFAAAVSSLTSILAALSQTSLSAFYLPLRERFLKRVARDPNDALTNQHEDKRTVLVSRGFVLIWGVILAAMAYVAHYASQHYPSILDLGLAMAGYAGGALIAGFLLSFFDLNIDSRGFMYSGPLSVLCVFAVKWHAEVIAWSWWVCVIFAGVLLAIWVILGIVDLMSRREDAVEWALKTILLLVGIALMLWLNQRGYLSRELTETGAVTTKSIGWPWYAPLGSTVAFIWGYLLSRPKPIPTETSHPPLAA